MGSQHGRIRGGPSCSSSSCTRTGGGGLCAAAPRAVDPRAAGLGGDSCNASTCNISSCNTSCTRTRDLAYQRPLVQQLLVHQDLGGGGLTHHLAVHQDWGLPSCNSSSCTRMAGLHAPHAVDPGAPRPGDPRASTPRASTPRATGPGGLVHQLLVHQLLVQWEGRGVVRELVARQDWVKLLVPQLLGQQGLVQGDGSGPRATVPRATPPPPPRATPPPPWGWGQRSCNSSLCNRGPDSSPFPPPPFISSSPSCTGEAPLHLGGEGGSSCIAP